MRLRAAAILLLAFFFFGSAQAQTFSDNYPKASHWFGQAFGVKLPVPGRSVSLTGVVPPLAAKAREIVAACGSRVISAVRRTRVRGSGRLSLHASGRAVDLAGNPSCIYAHLKNWPGGVSTDYHSVRCGRSRCPHVHVSYSPGGSEWGLRFAHYGTKRRAHRVAAAQ